MALEALLSRQPLRITLIQAGSNAPCGQQRREIRLEPRPIDIARQLGISTAALRHYEVWGIVPPVPRGPNGYRVYSQTHIAYFTCIRAMNDGFGMPLLGKAMRKMVAGEIDGALWLVSEAQARLVRDKRAAEQTIELLDTAELDLLDARGKRRWMTIGEVSRETSVPASAIRHWEQAGLLSVSRSEDNGYRRFSPPQVRRILIIATLRKAVWSLDAIGKVMRELDRSNVEQARKIARDSLQFLHRKNRDQMRGIHHLHRLVELVQADGELKKSTDN